MFFQTEYPTVVKTDAFENSVAIQQAVIEHGDFCVLLGEKFAVDKNFRFRDLPASISFGGIYSRFGRFFGRSPARLRLIENSLIHTVTIRFHRQMRGSCAC